TRPCRLIDVIPDIKRSRIGRSGRRYISSWLLMVLEPTAAWSVTGERGRQGCADRRFSGMKTASLQGRIHGVSARPCLPHLTRNNHQYCLPNHQPNQGQQAIHRSGNGSYPPRPCTRPQPLTVTSHKSQKTKNPPIRRVFWQKERDLT